MTRRARRALRLVTATAVVAAASVLLAPPAGATAYRYWTYWHGTASGGWAFSHVGATYVPPDGAVEGWRFGVSTVAGSLQPRTAASYDGICGSHPPAGTGRKLVALVVDYGTAADAPPGQHPPAGVDTFCADLSSDAIAYQVLSAYSSVRSQDGLVCGIDGYPTGECGVPVASPAPTPTHRPSPAPTPQATASTAASRRAAATAGSQPSAADVAGSRAAAATPSRAAKAAGSSDKAATASPTTGVVAVGPSGRVPPNQSGSSPPPAALAGLALVAVVGGAAVVRSRRRRR